MGHKQIVLFFLKIDFAGSSLNPNASFFLSRSCGCNWGGLQFLVYHVVRGINWNRLQGYLIRSEIWCSIHTRGGKICGYRHLAKQELFTKYDLAHWILPVITSCHTCLGSTPPSDNIEDLSYMDPKTLTSP